MAEYYDCSNESVSYNIMGIATVTYTIFGNSATPSISDSITIGNRNFFGVITNYTTQPVPNTENDPDGPFYNTNVTLLAVS